MYKGHRPPRACSGHSPPDRDRCGEGAKLGNLGLDYYELGEYRETLNYYNKHLGITHDVGDLGGEGNALWSEAILLQKMNNLDKAIEKASEALESSSRLNLPAL